MKVPLMKPTLSTSKQRNAISKILSEQRNAIYKDFIVYFYSAKLFLDFYRDLFQKRYAIYRSCRKWLSILLYKITNIIYMFIYCLII